MKILIRIFLLVASLCICADQPWLRTVDAPHGGRELQTALRHFTFPQYPGRSVVLLGVSHIGAEAYYQSIQEKLDAAALVLYEGIDGDRPEFRNATPEDFKDAGLQADLAAALGLRFQLAEIRYNREHFKNSDLTSLELLALFRGEDADTLDEEALRKLQTLLEAMQNEGATGKILENLLAKIGEKPAWRRGLRWSLAEVLGSLQGDLSATPALPPDLKRLFTALLQRRNDTVVRDVKAVLSDPQGPRQIVVFYGAAHMHDLEQRLMKDFAAIPGETEWLAAFRGNINASGLGRMEKTALRWFTEEQVRALNQFFSK